MVGKVLLKERDCSLRSQTCYIKKPHSINQDQAREHVDMSRC